MTTMAEAKSEGKYDEDDYFEDKRTARARDEADDEDASVEAEFRQALGKNDTGELMIARDKRAQETAAGFRM